MTNSACKRARASVYFVSSEMWRKISGLMKLIKTLYLASSVMTVSLSVSMKLSIVVIQCTNLLAFPPSANVPRSSSSFQVSIPYPLLFCFEDV